jgi:hypothetical protein
VGVTDSSQSAWRFIVLFEIDGADMDAAENKLDALNKAAKKLGISQGMVDNSGPPREDAP